MIPALPGGSKFALPKRQRTVRCHLHVCGHDCQPEASAETVRTGDAFYRGPAATANLLRSTSDEVGVCTLARKPSKCK